MRQGVVVHNGGAGRVAATEAAKGGFGYELPETVHG